MNIRYNSIIRVLKANGYRVKSVNEFIDENLEDLKESFVVAQVIEDYDYLSALTNEGNKYGNYDIIDHEEMYFLNPIILERNAYFNLFELARLYIDIRVDKKIFYQIIETECKNQEFEPDSLYLQFDMNIERIIKSRILSEKKIGRNEPCPCGSGKKYKHCHGVNS